EPAPARGRGPARLGHGVLLGWAAGLVIPGGAIRALPGRGRSLPTWGRAGAAHHAADREDARESHPHADVRGAAARLAPHARALRARCAAAPGHGPARPVAVRTVQAMGMTFLIGVPGRQVIWSEQRAVPL